MENKSYSDPCYDKYKNVLKGAKHGEVVTRFPPEPSGYLHIGHVKAAMLNYHYAKMYGGKMILRFDDTNPMNEKIEFVENITKDLETLGIKPDQITFTSDHFDHIKGQMDKLISLGAAYADDTNAEEMKAQRDEGIESKYRQTSIEDNMKIFQDMVAGKAPTFCIRAKMNMQDKVKCLRDPVFYRCKDQVHHKTGDKYKAYPTYDFACPIVDSLEGVTWALRSIEYRDRAALYDWVLNKLELRKVNLYEFSRLNLVSTVLSKRTLKWFVEGGLVDGWSDPRFPTVQGIMRRGMTSDSLKLFMLDQGASKNTNMMEWDKIWAFNKDIIDPQSKRYNAIVKSTACHMVIENGPETTTIESHPYHAKNPQLGQKPVIYSKKLYIEKDDAESIAEGEKVTLMKWGNATVSKKVVEGDVITLHATIDTADKDFKKTKKISWIANDPASNVEVTLNELDHLITKQKIEETDKIEEIANKGSKITYQAIAEGNITGAQKGDFIQIERRGFFYVDSIQLGNTPMVLNFVPDGKQKAMSAISHKIDAKQLAVGKPNAEPANKKAAKQQNVGEDGEVKLSKKDLKKAAKKENKNAAKAANKEGGKQEEAGDKQQKGKQQEKPKAAAPKKAVVQSQDGLKQMQELEIRLNGGKQFLCGNQPSMDDKEALEVVQVALLDPFKFPNLYGWYNFVNMFTEPVRNSWARVQAGGASKPAKKEAPKKKDDDDLDLFGSDDDDDAAAAEALKKKAAEAKAKKDKPKKVVIAKSLVLFEVKPYEAETKMADMAAEILKINKDGLWWKTEWKTEPVAFGIEKLIIGCTVEDSKVSVDDLQEEIEGLEELVQSVEIIGFNKI